MQPILYFTTFTAVAMLIVSAVALAFWLSLKCLETLIRTYFAITDPRVRAANRRRKRQRYLHHAHHLKRAGQ